MVLKLSTNLAIITLAVLAVSRPQAFIGLALVFAGLASFNTYQATAGHPDCGCFAIAIAPWLTATLDAAMAIACACATSAREAWRAPAGQVAALMIAGSLTAATLGWHQPNSDKAMVGAPHELLPVGIPDSFSLLVYRSDCPKCVVVASRFRELSEDRQVSLLTADLASQVVASFPTGEKLQGLVVTETVRSLSHVPVPSLVRVSGRRIVSVEDAAKMRQW